MEEALALKKISSMVKASKASCSVVVDSAMPDGVLYLKWMLDVFIRIQRKEVSIFDIKR